MGDTCDGCGSEIPFLSPSCPACGEGLEWYLEMECECSEILRYDEGTYCRRCQRSYSPWEFIAHYVRVNCEDGEKISISPEINPPGDIAREGEMALPTGQWYDYRIPLTDGSAVHVKVYGDRYEAHLDKVDPAKDPVGHAFVDAPVPMIFAVGAVAAAGYAVMNQS